jgi:hypothetical protein
MSNPTEGRPHNLNCCLKNGKLEDDLEYVYEGRTEDSIIQEVDEALTVSTDVSIEGEELVRKYSVDHITMVPSQIWDIVNKTLSAKYPTYHGVNRNSVLNAVQKHRKAYKCFISNSAQMNHMVAVCLFSVKNTDI